MGIRWQQQVGVIGPAAALENVSERERPWPLSETHFWHGGNDHVGGDQQI